VGIVASGGLDEHAIDALVRGGTPITGFGVGTHVSLSEDAPSLGMAYNLVSCCRPARRSFPVRSRPSASTTAADPHDLIAPLGEAHDAAQALLVPVMRDGERIAAAEPLAAARARCRAAIAAVPEAIRELAPAEPGYRVRVSERFASMAPP
jgi:nicotinate phosphoribosyltransferase